MLHWWHVSLSPVMQGVTAEYILAVLCNITPRKRHEETMNKAQRELQRSTEDLEGFARIAGHDLRAPLASIAHSSQLLLLQNQNNTGSQSRELLDYVVTSGKRVAQMLDDMLHYARISQGLPQAAKEFQSQSGHS